MDATNRLYTEIAKEKAREYAVIKRGYKTAAEKRAFTLAEKARRAQWLSALDTLDADERRARLKAFSVFKKQVVIASILPKKRAGKLHLKPVKPKNGHIFK